MREHPASDYKRVELTVGSELPDFQFSDFDGKKKKVFGVSRQVRAHRFLGIVVRAMS